MLKLELDTNLLRNRITMDRGSKTTLWTNTDPIMTSSTFSAPKIGFGPWTYWLKAVSLLRFGSPAAITVTARSTRSLMSLIDSS